MISRPLQHDKTPAWTFAFSLLIHLLAILICNHAALFSHTLRESTPYYVDLISLPTPDPAPARAPAAAAAPPAAAAARPPVAGQKPVMALPVKQAPQKTVQAPPSADQQREQEAREFAERMSRIERGADARHQAEALASLQKRAAEKRVTGTVTGAGAEKGADYGAYIQSRLKDALSGNMTYRSQNPEAAVHLYIDKSGRLIKYVMVRPSADKLFNNSVIRTIDKAKADFPPVPSGAAFDKLFVFSPQEVKK